MADRWTMFLCGNCGCLKPDPKISGGTKACLCPSEGFTRVVVVPEADLTAAREEIEELREERNRVIAWIEATLAEEKDFMGYLYPPRRALLREFLRRMQDGR